MDAFFTNIKTRRKIRVMICATYPLTRHILQVLLNDDRELCVIDAVGTTSELFEKISRRSPDVVLQCIMDNESQNIEILSDLRRIAPQSKVVILSSPNSLLDQPAAVKLGVSGIVGSNQHARILIRAIRQVSEGEVWLNQKLLAQLLDNNFNSSNVSKRNKNKEFYSDSLTNRELEIVAIIGLGMNNKDISKKLCISEATVRHHLSSIYGKLNIKDRLNLAIYAYRHQIVTPGLRRVDEI